MKCIFLSAIMILALAAPATSAELLTLDEQTFDAIDSGRWETYTWPDGGLRPPPIDNPANGVGGGTVTLSLATSAPTGWGTTSLEISDSAGGFDAFPDVGGVYITLDVVSGATYTISWYQAIFTLGTIGDDYNASGGISVDLDGGTDPLGVDYGFSPPGGPVGGNEFDSNRITCPDAWCGPQYAQGDWMWNATFVGGDNENEWFTPSEMTLDIQATSDQMTIFIWGVSKFYNHVIRFDGFSVDGPRPLPPAGSSDVDRWSLYR